MAGAPIKNPMKKRSAWQNAMPEIAWSQLNVPKAAISDTVLLCHAGLGEKFPIFLLRAIACARAPKAEMTSVATMIQMTFCPDRVSTTADPRAAARELIEMRTVEP